MITEFFCDRCGQKITLPKGERPIIYPKLEVSRDVCYACKNDIAGLDIKLNQKFTKIIREIDKEMFPFANNIIEVQGINAHAGPIYKIGDKATS